MAELTGDRAWFRRRSEELTTLRRLVPESPIVTVVGTGGIGKTRFVREALDALADDVPDGIRTVDLTTVDRSDGHVDETIAAAMGFTSLAAAIDELRSETSLVVLDNCEHVLDGVRRVVTSLTDAARDVRVIATSRAPLEVDGEYVFPLRPLPPDDALALLRSRADAAGAHLTSGSDADRALTDLAVRVDALPLALELAAMKLRSLDAAQVIAALDADLSVLGKGGVRPEDVATVDAPAHRHRSVVETIAWSYGLLGESPAAALRRLAVLDAGFDARRAHDVIGAPSIADTADLLDLLVSQSLVSTSSVDGQVRYRLLETVRQFAGAHLDLAGERDVTVERFIDAVERDAADIVTRAVSEWSESVIDDVWALAHDLLVAIKLCVERDGSGGRACALFLPAWGLIHDRYAGEFFRLGRRILDRWPDDTPGWGDIAAITATAAMRLSELDQAETIASRAVEVDGLVAPVVGRRARAMVREHRGDFELALDDVRAALERAERDAMDPFAGELQLFEVTLLGQLGRTDGALDASASARDRNRRLGSMPVGLWALVQAAHLCRAREPERSAQLVAQALDEIHRLEETGRSPQFIVTHHLGVLAACNRDLASASTWLRRSLRATRSAGEVPHAWSTLRWIGLLATSAPGDTDLDVVGASMTLGDAGGRLVRLCDRSPDAPALGAIDRQMFELVDRGGDDADADPLDVVGVPYDLGERLLDAIDVAVERTLELASDPTTASTDEPQGRPADGRLVARGDVWEVIWHDDRADVNVTKGLRDLASLLAQPGHEIAAAELMGSSVVEAGVDDSIDETARRGYEERLRELQAEIEEAENAHDLGRLDIAPARVRCDRRTAVGRLRAGWPPPHQRRLHREGPVRRHLADPCGDQEDRRRPAAARPPPPCRRADRRVLRVRPRTPDRLGDRRRLRPDRAADQVERVPPTP